MVVACHDILGVPLDANAQVGWGCTGWPELLGAQDCSRLPRAAASAKVATHHPPMPTPHHQACHQGCFCDGRAPPHVSMW